FFSSRRRHTRFSRDWSSDVCSSDLEGFGAVAGGLTSSSSNTVFLESASGIAEGARTGLANVVTGGLFLLAMFFTPLYEVVPVEEIGRASCRDRGWGPGGAAGGARGS